jgi:hypothetical protein
MTQTSVLFWSQLGNVSGRVLVPIEVRGVFPVTLLYLHPTNQPHR